MTENFFTDSGIAIEPVYTPEHLEKISFDYNNDLGSPGSWPLQGESTQKCIGLDNGLNRFTWALDPLRIAIKSY